MGEKSNENMKNISNNLNSSELTQKLQKQNLLLQNQITLLESKLNSFLEGGGIKIFFPDKIQAKQIISKVNPRILKELPHYSINLLGSPNLILEGDNLHALT